jgi:diacylglycerol kinase
MNSQEQERFSLVKRAKSFTHAGRGVFIFIMTTHNAWMHIVALISAVGLGFYCDITQTEWMLLVFAGGFVLVSEAFNTALEMIWTSLLKSAIRTRVILKMLPPAPYLCPHVLRL